MSAFAKLTTDRQKLIIHRVTRSVAEKLQREDIVALYGLCYMEITMHKPHNAQLGPEALRKAYDGSTSMLHATLQVIQHKRSFDWNQVLLDVLREEGITEPTSDDVTALSLEMVRRPINEC